MNKIYATLFIDSNNQNSYNNYKGVTMQTVTASEIKQNSTLLQNALKDDMLITKRDKPFVVVLDYERYQELIAKSQSHAKNDWIEKTFGVMEEEEADTLLDDIHESRVNKEIDVWS